MVLTGIVFYFFSVLIFIFEGINLNPFSESMTVVLFLNLPILINWLNFRQVYFPKKATVVYLIFLVFSALSMVFSNGGTVGLRALLFSVSGFWLFVYGYQNKKILKRPIIIFLLAVCLFFSLLSYLGFIFPVIKELLEQVSTGTTYFFLAQAFHNHLGDWLGLAIIILISLINKNPWRLWTYLLMLFFLPLFFLSQSRSAFLALMITFILMGITKNYSRTITKFVAGGLIIVSLLFLAVTIKEINFLPAKNLRTFFLQKNLIIEKNWINLRDQYFFTAIKGFETSPIFGVGTGQYYSLSKKYAAGKYQASPTSHNIFLDLLSERGLFGVTSFLIFLCLVLMGKKSLHYWLLVYLLINFQTDYTFILTSFLWVFFILAGVCLEDENININKKIYYLILSVNMLFPQALFLLSFVR